MSCKKPAPDPDLDPKVRNCLSCRIPFESAWAGERICGKCKGSSSWRAGVPRQFSPPGKRV